MKEFNPVERFDHWPHSVNWKMVSYALTLMVCVLAFGMVHMYGSGICG